MLISHTKGNKMANLIYDYYSGQDLYSDGAIEDEILDVVSNNSDYTE